MSNASEVNVTLLAVAVSVVLGQSPVPPALPAATCGAPADTAIASLCVGEDALTQGERLDASDAEREDATTRAAAAFRRAADLTRDPAVKKRALDQLARAYDENHLNLPHNADPVLRELIAMSPGDVTPMFRLAKLQERQELFDAAESTLLAAKQLKPDDIAPYRELAQYFTRRAATLSANKEREERANHPEELAKPDKDGVYPIGDPIQPPKNLSSEGMEFPSELKAAGITGSVGLELVLDETGRVRDAKIVRSVPGLDATALAMVRLWRYAPAMLNGRPVPVRLRVVIQVGGGAI